MKIYRLCVYYYLHNTLTDQGSDGPSMYSC